MSSAPPPVRCREIGDADIDAVIDLLTSAFREHGRSRAFWVHALERLSQHVPPAGFPKYGYLMESGGRIVGVILLIFSVVPDGEEKGIRCNGSSFYVEPAYRGYAAMLASRVLRHKNVTYLNITPDPHTLPMIAAQGYVRYSSGRLSPFRRSRPDRAARASRFMPMTRLPLPSCRPPRTTCWRRTSATAA